MILKIAELTGWIKCNHQTCQGWISPEGYHKESGLPYWIEDESACFRDLIPYFDEWHIMKRLNHNVEFFGWKFLSNVTTQCLGEHAVARAICTAFLKLKGENL